MQIAVNFQDKTIIDNFKDGLKEIALIKQGKINSRPIQEFLNEL